LGWQDLWGVKKKEGKTVAGLLRRKWTRGFCAGQGKKEERKGHVGGVCEARSVKTKNQAGAWAGSFPINFLVRVKPNPNGEARIRAPLAHASPLYANVLINQQPSDFN